VEVQAPLDCPFVVQAAIVVRPGYDAEAVRQAALASVTARCAEIASRLGRDVACSGLIAALHAEGVASVNLVAPNADMSVPAHAWAHATSITVTVEGMSDG
jgi:phage-related baseplate assembly protein